MQSNNNILLIEDSPSDADLAKRAFRKAKIANPLIHVEDGQEALDFLFAKGKYSDRDPGELPALVLLDLKLPGIDGLEVLRRIRNDPSTHRLLVVVLTSSHEEKDIVASYDLGVNSYIRKPVDFNQFADVVAQLGLYWIVINQPPI